MARKKKIDSIEIPAFVIEDAPKEEQVAAAANAASETAEMTLNDILAIIKDAYQSIPFNETFFELRNFSLGGTVSPTKTYCTIGKLLVNELVVFFEQKLDIIRIENEMERLTKSLDTPMTELERRERHARIDVSAVKLFSAEHSAQEALDKVGYLFNEFKKYPRFTRQDIESQEERHYLVSALQEGETGLPLLNDILINNPEKTKNLIELLKRTLPA